MDWQTIGSAGVYTLAALICLVGFLLSCISLSGTWLVLGAGALLAWHNRPGFPGIWTLLALLAICVAVEAAEALAGVWGVRRRGGSKAAGLAALVGGLLGLFLGAFIPIPVIGSLIGMLAGSFGLAFLAEHARMKQTDHAAHVAAGAVLARLAVIFLKIGATLLLIFILVVGLIAYR